MTPSRPALLATWAAVTALLGGGLLTVRLGMSPLDDPDPGHQRPGYVDANRPRSPAAPLPGLAPAGRRSVVFFTRADRLPRLRRALDGSDGQALRRAASIVLVQDTTGPADAGVLPDPSDRISHAYVMRRPRDHGAPVGYAVVGADGTVRYRTEDPQQDQHLAEVLTMVDAT